MNTMIQLRVSTAEGALLRVLSVARRRGFEIARLVANRSDREACVDVAMMVEGERPVDILVRQLEKLFDVEEVRVTEMLPLSLPLAEPGFADAAVGHA
jgi:acetolactate synthase regulatory subunit